MVRDLGGCDYDYLLFRPLLLIVSTCSRVSPEFAHSGHLSNGSNLTKTAAIL